MAAECAEGREFLVEEDDEGGAEGFPGLPAGEAIDLFGQVECRVLCVRKLLMCLPVVVVRYCQCVSHSKLPLC